MRFVRGYEKEKLPAICSDVFKRKIEVSFPVKTVHTYQDDTEELNVELSPVRKNWKSDTIENILDFF